VNPFFRVQPIEQTTYVTAADELFKNATKAEQLAYLRFHAVLREWFEYIPDNFDMEVFLKLASTARKRTSCGDPQVDRLLNLVLAEFSEVGYPSNDFANGNVFANSFNFPHDPNMFEPTNSKSRSEENINTNFSPRSGEFGQYDFAPPPTTGRKTSPSRRTTRNRTPGEHPRSATMDVPQATAPPDPRPSRPWGSDGLAKENISTAPASGTGQDPWSSNPFSFQPQSGSPTRSGAAGQPRKQSQGRRTSKASNRGAATAKATQQPPVVDEDDTIEVEGADGTPEHGAPVMDDPEPMDIDNTPPAQNGTGIQQPQNEAKLYSVPRSRRQEQEQKQQNVQRHRKTSSAARKPVPTASSLQTNLDDLRNTEPIGKSADSSGGLNSLESMSATLPVQSQAAAHIIKPNKLNMPPVPRAPAEPTKLTKASWPTYVQKFAAYIRAFHDFNQAMIQHFAAREQMNDLNFKDPTKWLEAAGDTSGLLMAPTGFGVYLAMVQEDEQVREHWNVGCDKHAEAVQAFGKVRERVRKSVEGGGLADH
jgi:hypothetical protein